MIYPRGIAKQQDLSSMHKTSSCSWFLDIFVGIRQNKVPVPERKQNKRTEAGTGFLLILRGSLIAINTIELIAQMLAQLWF